MSYFQLPKKRGHHVIVSIRYIKDNLILNTSIQLFDLEIKVFKVALKITFFKLFESI